MTKAIGFKAKYTHDCPRCTFLLHYIDWDIYYCPQFEAPHEVPTLVLRAGPETNQYLSFPFFSHRTLLEDKSYHDQDWLRLTTALQLGRVVAHMKELFDLEKEELKYNTSTLAVLRKEIGITLKEFAQWDAACDEKGGTDIGEAWDWLRLLRNQLEHVDITLRLKCSGS